MKFLSVQSLRGVAAVLVVIHHYNSSLLVLEHHGIGMAPELFKLGHMKIIGAIGVPIFFVISGFVMGVQSFQPSLTAVRTFLTKRFARIVPLYWTLTIAFAAFVSAAPGDLIRSLLFIEYAHGRAPVIAPGWSLEFEVFFYLVFAFVVASGMAASRIRGTLIITAFFATLVYGNNISGGTVFYKIGSPHVLEFCCGLLVSHVYRLPTINRLWGLYLALGIAAAAWSITTNSNSFEFISILWLTTGFFLVLGLVSAETRGFVIMKSNPLVGLGDASYALYLVHMTLIPTLFPWILWRWRLNTYVEPHIAMALLVLIPVALSFPIHWYFERPAGRLVSVLLLPNREGRPARLHQILQKPSAAS